MALRFARRADGGSRYSGVNARLEPDLSPRFILRELHSFERVADVHGLVRGSDGQDWLEAMLDSGECIYLNAAIVEYVALGPVPATPSAR